MLKEKATRGDSAGWAVMAMLHGDDGVDAVDWIRARYYNSTSAVSRRIRSILKRALVEIAHTHVGREPGGARTRVDG